MGGRLAGGGIGLGLVLLTSVAVAQMNSFGGLGGPDPAPDASSLLTPPSGFTLQPPAILGGGSEVPSEKPSDGLGLRIYGPAAPASPTPPGAEHTSEPRDLPPRQ